MSLVQQAPRLAAHEAGAFARAHYGLDASAVELTSERDQNFLLETAGGERFVLKIANATEDRALLEAQNGAMAHAGGRTGLCPQVVASAAGGAIAEHRAGGQRYFVRLLTWLSGTPLASVKRHPPALFEDVGRGLGDLDKALESYDHPAIHRDFHWDLGRGLETVRRHVHEIADEATRREIAGLAAGIELRIAPVLPRLRRQTIHGDANDHNVVVEGTRLVGFIDFGDMVHSLAVADLAIAIAYAVLETRDPLAAAQPIVRGYHGARPLADEEFEVLWDLVLLRLATSVALAAHQQGQRPADEYLGISQGPIARTLPRLMARPSRFAAAAFRHACGLDPSPASSRAAAWFARQAAAAPVESDPSKAMILDLSVGSPLVSLDPAESHEPAVTSRILKAMASTGAAVGIGRYGEPRLLYSTGLFAGADAGDERRTIHLGIDLFAPAGTPVHAALDGTVHLAADNAAPLDYGPLIILRHETDAGALCYTLYGHLTRESLDGMEAGRPIVAGDRIAAIGTAEVNGGWTPHLHFQIITDLLDLGRDYPGVCRASERDLWQVFSPDPCRLLKQPAAAYPVAALDVDRAVTERRARTGVNLSIGYRSPLKIVRGWKQFLFDATGRRYVDAYNNVPHVGHAHPEVVRAVAEQSRVLNTNTRYLHDSLARYAERLTATLPDPLRVCYFVNSGSEANELALRLARAHTRRRDVIVLEHAYHGNTTTLIDLSPYKFNGPGGEGAPPWVHVAPVPDVYRGRYRAAQFRAPADGREIGAKYAGLVADTIGAINAGGPGSRLCAFIAETCPSVAGQILLPEGYPAAVYAHVRAAGGLCIADEVQTAYGRMGTDFYAFEAHDVVPDIVVLGKPIGNGYPLGAVVTTREIARSFDNGMEFFSTFGGSTVSCAAGLAVLDVVEREGLQRHAERVGSRLLDGLRPLGNRHKLVGDVRGSGLFLGVELVQDRVTLEPAAGEASYVVNRMREEGILLGTDGPFHNVLKIRPPMPFDFDDADRLVETLDEILAEVPE